ncbi:ZIP family metal transporter [Nonlabens ponticola]|uniref:ZIP family metal transporter n=1 Tax=Nonlabens ponticola TaxID=2496866 RepID=A0A3S9MZV1_9FLAO|nr:ZIP family metal transporter [Nonlabens ponticola]AZQ44771.1 ZIP family metal transporter [Nonlabens ponticola]
MNYLFTFLAVVAGALLAWQVREISRKRLKLLLAFSGALLLSAVATEFLPEIYTEGSVDYGIYLIAGVFIQIILEFFSKGAEHGHLHIDKNVSAFPYALFLSLCLHAFLEGMPLQSNDSMVYAIAVHKLPIAFIFTAFLIANKASFVRIFIVMSIFAAMSPLGTLLAAEIGWVQEVMLPIKAIVAGIVLHVSTTLILESSDGHKFNLAKLLAMILGAALAFLI